MVPATTRYRSSRRTALVLAGFLLFALAVPFLILIDEDGPARIRAEFARDRFVFVASVVFWLVFAAIMIAAVRASHLMAIECGPEVCRYRLPQATTWDFFRRPFALRTGEIPYSMIIGVEKRRELIKWGQTCTAVCLVVRDRPLHTFVRGGVRDDQWVEEFARDIAARAHVSLVDRGTASAMWVPWR